MTALLLHSNSSGPFRGDDSTSTQHCPHKFFPILHEILRCHSIISHPSRRLSTCLIDCPLSPCIQHCFRLLISPRRVNAYIYQIVSSTGPTLGSRSATFVMRRACFYLPELYQRRWPINPVFQFCCIHLTSRIEGLMEAVSCTPFLFSSKSVRSLVSTVHRRHKTASLHKKSHAHCRL